MQIAHISARVTETVAGVLLAKIQQVTAKKNEDPDVKDSTKATYRIRLGQVTSYFTRNGIIGMAPDQWDEHRNEHFYRFMRAELHYCPEVVRRCQDLVHKALETCQREGLIKSIPARIKIRRKKPVPVFCTPEEVELLAGHRFASQRLAQVRDLFLVQCYSGVSYSDLTKLDRRHVTHIEGYPMIIDQRQKEDEEPFAVPLIPQLGELLDRYSWRLPIISNQKYNQYLKEVAEVVGINKALRTHDGRRTAGMYYLHLTGSIDVSSAVLGHADTRTTQRHYARYYPVHLARALKKAEGIRKAM